MAQQYHNPFVKLGLIAPIAQRNHDYEEYCQTQMVGKAKIDRVPFRRMVDLWFAGLSLAARKQLKPVDLSKEKTSQFITGEIFDGNDSWRIQIITLVAIAIEGNLEVVQNPRRMMDIANGLAAAGVPHIVKMLSEGNQDSIWNLSDALDDLLKFDSYEEDYKDSKDISNALNEALR